LGDTYPFTSVGQHKPVTLYRFITRDTIAAKIRHLQEKKQALADGLIESNSL